MRTVLIADDSKTSQMLVKTTLQRIPDLEFVTADDGREALALMEKEHVDLLVTDINMPEMDGIELVRAVRKQRGTRTIPILIITAKGEEAARDQGLALGANGYILKPLSGRALTELAVRLLDGSPPVSV
jgi:two-component system, chemotaxis family, chemotaxis protein CheY